MSEKKAEYKVDQSITQDLDDAIEMLGKGYPSVTIEPPRKLMEKRKDFEEVSRPAWIKFSTAFKLEMKNIKPNALKVWIYIALSVNYSGVAFPGIRTIADNIGVSHQTVLTAIKELEDLGLLSVKRGEARHNFYQLSDDFVTIGRGTEPVQKLDQSNLEAPIGLNDTPDESSGLDSNKKEQDINKKDISSKEKPDLLDGILFYAGQAVEQQIDVIEDVLNLLEKGLRRNIPRQPDWQSLAKWIIKQDNLSEWITWYMSDEFRATTSWRLNPQQIKNSWPQAPKKYVAPKPEPPKEKEVYLSGEELVRRMKGDLK